MESKFHVVGCVANITWVFPCRSDHSRAKAAPSAELFLDWVTSNDVLEVVGHVAQLDSKSQARAEFRPGAGHISRPTTGRMMKRDLELGAHKAGVEKKERSSGS